MEIVLIFICFDSQSIRAVKSVAVLDGFAKSMEIKPHAFAFQAAQQKMTQDAEYGYGQ